MTEPSDLPLATASDRFELVSPYQPAGDQPQAIEKLVAGFDAGQDADDGHRDGQFDEGEAGVAMHGEAPDGLEAG